LPGTGLPGTGLPGTKRTVTGRSRTRLARTRLPGTRLSGLGRRPIRYLDAQFMRAGRRAIRRRDGWQLAHGLGWALFAGGGPAPRAPARRPRPGPVRSGTVSRSGLARGRAAGAVVLIVTGTRGRLGLAPAGLLAVLAALGLAALLRSAAVAPPPAA